MRKEVRVSCLREGKSCRVEFGGAKIQGRRWK
jgi:hypothetical protein